MTPRERLEAARARGGIDDESRAALAALPASDLDTALRDFAAGHGAGALPVLAALADEPGARELRRAAKRALYRLAQQGVVTPAPSRPAARPVIPRRAERAVRAWISGIDGTGSRATWIVFESALGGFALCSLILNDVAGILDAAGGDITRKRLDAELARLRASQKLPWVSVEPARALRLVGEALALHTARETAPPTAFARWRARFDAAATAEPPPAAGGAGAATPLTEGAAIQPAPAAPASVSEADLERSVELLELPEFAGWFLDPAALQSDAVELLQARESRLVVSDQIRAERETAIVDAVLERELPPLTRARWIRRLDEMAFILEATARPEQARLAAAAATGLRDESRPARRHPFAVQLARRGLEVAADVALSKVSLADVTRQPGAGSA